MLWITVKQQPIGYGIGSSYLKDGLWSPCHPIPSHPRQTPHVHFTLMISIPNIYISAFVLPAICRNGCNNGGTCVSPNRCRCSYGWSGSTCSYGRSWTTSHSFTSSLLFTLILLVDLRTWLLVLGGKKFAFTSQNKFFVGFNLFQEHALKMNVN